MNVLVWIGYCALVSTILLAGAAALEVAARWSGRPSRAGWLVALAGSVTLPWLLRLLPDNTLIDVVPLAMPAFVLDPITATSSATGGWTIQGVGSAAWITMSALMVTYVCAMMLALSRARRAWRMEHIDGGPVLVSETTGPAALGVARAAVVMPAWVLELDAGMRSMLLRHERSHVDAGDPRLLFAGLLLLAAMPWNPVVWFQFMRLRNAIELDCDARVLSTGADPVHYGSLLLEVGRRRSAGTFVMATFAEPRVFLEERIRRIARWPLERHRGRAAVFATIAVLMFGAALSCDPAKVTETIDSVPQAQDLTAEPLMRTILERELNLADTLEGNGATSRVFERQPMPADTLAARPVFTPYTVAPELLNVQQTTEVFSASYPPLLRDAGIGGRATIWLLIDSLGAVQSARIKESAGHSALDAAALQVASMMRFSPALDRGRRVSVWIEIPMVFTPVSRPGSEALEKVDEVVRVPVGQTRSGERPDLLNRSAVTRKMIELYPPDLRDAGIGGTAVLTFSIDGNGVVSGATLKASSGHASLDAVAISLAPEMQFEPTRRDGRNVPVVVDIPVSFTAR